MKKLILITLFLLSACGANPEDPAASKFKGIQEFMSNSFQKSPTQKPSSADSSKPILKPDATPITPPAKAQVPPGYVCNGDYCIEEPSKEWQAAHPDRDAMGFRKNITAVPYDPCREKGECEGDDK